MKRKLFLIFIFFLMIALFSVNGYYNVFGFSNFKDSVICASGTPIIYDTSAVEDWIPLGATQLNNTFLNTSFMCFCSTSVSNGQVYLNTTNNRINISSLGMSCAAQHYYLFFKFDLPQTFTNISFLCTHNKELTYNPNYLEIYMYNKYNVSSMFFHDSLINVCGNDSISSVNIADSSFINVTGIAFVSFNTNNFFDLYQIMLGEFENVLSYNYMPTINYTFDTFACLHNDTDSINIEITGKDNETDTIYYSMNKFKIDYTLTYFYEDFITSDCETDRSFCSSPYFLSNGTCNKNSWNEWLILDYDYFITSAGCSGWLNVYDGSKLFYIVASNPIKSNFTLNVDFETFNNSRFNITLMQYAQELYKINLIAENNSLYAFFNNTLFYNASYFENDFISLITNLTTKDNFCINGKCSQIFDNSKTITSIKFDGFKLDSPFKTIAIYTILLKGGSENLEPVFTTTKPLILENLTKGINNFRLYYTDLPHLTYNYSYVDIVFNGLECSEIEQYQPSTDLKKLTNSLKGVNTALCTFADNSVKVSGDSFTNKYVNVCEIQATIFWLLAILAATILGGIIAYFFHSYQIAFAVSSFLALFFVWIVSLIVNLSTVLLILTGIYFGIGIVIFFVSMFLMGGNTQGGGQIDG